MNNLTGGHLTHWYQRDGGARLNHDRDSINTLYPELEFRILEGRVVLEGLIRLQLECGIERVVQVRLEFPDDYPQKEPRAFDSAKQFPHIPNRHFFLIGQCCLWLPPESLWDSQASDALLMFLHQVAIFFEKQLIYNVLHRWPGKQRGHGEQGYREWMCEVLQIEETKLHRFIPTLLGKSCGATAPCPCDSNLKFRRCHRDRVAKIISLVDLKTCAAVLG